MRLRDSLNMELMTGQQRPQRPDGHLPTRDLEYQPSRLRLPSRIVGYEFFRRRIILPPSAGCFILVAIGAIRTFGLLQPMSPPDSKNRQSGIHFHGP
jgi:hypothetical protein